MSENIDQFAIYSAKIFQQLYDSFPVPRRIDEEEIISEYLTFDRDEELQELKTSRDMADLVDFLDDEDLKARVREKLPRIKERISSLEYEQRTDRYRQEQIYNGTIEFLVYEGLFRESESGAYQLTSKGFSHLNKSFMDGTISEDNSTNISVLKAIFEKSSNTSLQVAAGTAVNVLTRILGYG